MYRCVIVNVPVCTNAFVRGHVFVGVLSKPPSLFLCVDIVRCVQKYEKGLDLIMQCVGQSVQFGSSHLQAVGSYCAVCWILAFGSLC